MATFPTTLKIALSSKPIPRDGRVVDADGDGKSRVRKLHADVFDFDLDLTRMSSAEVTTLFTFYNANSVAVFDFVWPPDGVTYSVKFLARPALTDFRKGPTFTYKVKLGAA